MKQFEKVASIRDLALELFESQRLILSDNDATLVPLPLYSVIHELKKLINDMEPDVTHFQLKNRTTQWINEFYTTNFEIATKLIIEHVGEKIRSLQAKNILTFGR